MFQRELSVAGLIEECVCRPTADAWTRLIGRLQPLVAGAVYRVAARHGAAAIEEIDDIVQDVFLKLGAQGANVLSRVPRETDATAIAYLKVVAINAARDHFGIQYSIKRGGKNLVGASSKIEELALVLEREPAEQSILFSQIDAVLEAGQRDRTVFWLYFRQGFTAKEISAIPSLGLSAKGVESLIHRMTAGVRTALRGATGSIKGEGASAPS
jgi:RNA polymerase sigma-70 factor, ECF subfamily